MTEVKMTKRKHHVYVSWIGIKDIHTPSSTGQITGKWQYLAESPKGKISIVELLEYFRPGKTLWGIYCLEGQLFKRIERFNSFYEAEAAAKSYLG
jgi:hypothetical protein